MRPAALVPILVFVVLCLGAAWLEYSQHSGLMLQAASADVAQLCSSLKAATVCPKSQRFPTRAAKDPWSRPYRCRSASGRLLIYTMGADNQRGGSGRDADIVCVHADASPDGEDGEEGQEVQEVQDAEACACFVGAEASALLTGQK
jgi:hypothetical protein